MKLFTAWNQDGRVGLAVNTFWIIIDSYLYNFVVNIVLFAIFDRKHY